MYENPNIIPRRFVPAWYYNFRYGGKRVFLTGIGATATLTLLTPVLTKTGTGFLVTTRILEGLFEVSHRTITLNEISV